MKTFLTILTLSLTTIGAHAGTPYQDPVVAKIQSEFETGKVPEASDLKFGKNWNCIEYTALSNNFNVSTLSTFWNFNAFDGIIQNSLANATGGFANFAADSQALEGVNPNYIDYMESIRVSTEGDLILEFSSTTDDYTSITVPSIAHPNYRLVSYSVCPANLVSSTVIP